VPNPGCLFISHGPKTFPVTWLTGNQIIILLIKNSPDQVEGYLDYLQPVEICSIPTAGYFYLALPFFSKRKKHLGQVFIIMKHINDSPDTPFPSSVKKLTLHKFS
jgi:hypothetical protein